MDRETIEQVMPELLEVMEVNIVLLTFLVSHGVLTQLKRKSIMAERTNADKVDHLMDHIMKDLRNKYEPLLEALKFTDQHHVVDILTGAYSGPTSVHRSTEFSKCIKKLKAAYGRISSRFSLFKNHPKLRHYTVNMTSTFTDLRLLDGSVDDSVPVTMNQALNCGAKNFVISGAQGSGKSCCILNVADVWGRTSEMDDPSTEPKVRNPLPDYIKQVIHISPHDCKSSLDETVKSILHYWCGDVSYAAVDHYHDYPEETAILVDSLDEVAHNDELINDIFKTMDNGKRLMVVGCRSNHPLLDEITCGHKLIHVDGFDERHVKMYIEKFFEYRGLHGQDIVHRFKQAIDEDSKLAMIVRHPLVLSLMCIFLVAGNYVVDDLHSVIKIDIFNKITELVLEREYITDKSDLELYYKFSFLRLVDGGSFFEEDMKRFGIREPRSLPFISSHDPDLVETKRGDRMLLPHRSFMEFAGAMYLVSCNQRTRECLLIFLAGRYELNSVLNLLVHLTHLNIVTTEQICNIILATQPKQLNPRHISLMCTNSKNRKILKKFSKLKINNIFHEVSQVIPYRLGDIKPCHACWRKENYSSTNEGRSVIHNAWTCMQNIQDERERSEVFSRTILPLLLEGRESLRDFRAHFPQELKQPDLKAEMAFRRALREGSTKTCRGRVVLLGRAGVGKTSVKNSLLGKDFNKEHDMTELLNINYVTVDDEGCWTEMSEQEMQDYEFNYNAALAMRSQMETDVEKTSDRAPGRNLGRGAGREPDREPEMEPEGESGESGREPGRELGRMSGRKPGTKLRKKPEKVLSKGSLKEHEMVTGEMPEKVKLLNQNQEDIEEKDVFHLWDFGGQVVYYIVHQLFITAHTIFLLVADASRPLDSPVDPDYAAEYDDRFIPQSTERGFLQYFLRTVKIWSKRKKGDGPPHIFVVCNKADKVMDKGKLEMFKHSVWEVIRKFSIENMMRGIVVYTCNPSCGNNDDSAEKVGLVSCGTLKQKLTKFKRDFLDDVPTKWIRFRNQLQEQPHEKYENVVKIAGRNGIQEEDVTIALQYFHNRRELVFWNTVELKDFVICQPTWLIKKMLKVITPNEEDEDIPVTAGTHKLIFNHEKILHEDLAKVFWGAESDFIIHIMIEYLLLMPWTKDQGKRRFMVPCLLKSMVDRHCPFQESRIPSIYVYLKDEVIPVGLACRLMTYLAVRKEWKHGENMPVMFYNGAIFSMVHKCMGVTICVREVVWKPSPGSEEAEHIVIKIYAQAAGEVTEKLYPCLNQVRNTVEEGLREILEMINVPCCIEVAAETKCGHELQPLKKEKLLDEVPCKFCFKGHSKKDYECWFYETKEEGPSQNASVTVDWRELAKKIMDGLKDHLVPFIEKSDYSNRFTDHIKQYRVVQDDKHEELKDLPLHQRMREFLVCLRRRSEESQLWFARALIETDQQHVLEEVLQLTEEEITYIKSM